LRISGWWGVATENIIKNNIINIKNNNKERSYEKLRFSNNQTIQVQGNFQKQFYIISL